MPARKTSTTTRRPRAKRRAPPSVATPPVGRLAPADLDEIPNLYSVLYDSAPVGYVTLNQSGVVLELNAMAADMLGGRVGAVGKPLLCFLDKHQSKKLFATCSAVRHRAARRRSCRCADGLAKRRCRCSRGASSKGARCS